jgi:hypothetical protein
MRVMWGWFAMPAVLLAASAVQAQTLAADEIRPYPPGAAMMEQGPYAEMPPPGAYDDAIPPFQALRIARATGFEPIGRPIRQRFVYVIAAVSPDGIEGHVMVDAHSGRVMRFAPTRVGERDPYDPPGLPPPAHVNARTSLRPPAPVPHVANRAPAPKPEAQPTETPAQQPSAAASPPAPIQQQAAAAPPKPDAVAAKPAPASPTPGAKPSVAMQPTQPMPPVQGLD